MVQIDATKRGVDYMARYSINNIKVSLYAFPVHCQISTNSPGFYKDSPMRIGLSQCLTCFNFLCLNEKP